MRNQVEEPGEDLRSPTDSRAAELAVRLVAQTGIREAELVAHHSSLMASLAGGLEANLTRRTGNQGEAREERRDERMVRPGEELEAEPTPACSFPGISRPEDRLKGAGGPSGYAWFFSLNELCSSIHAVIGSDVSRRNRVHAFPLTILAA